MSALTLVDALDLISEPKSASNRATQFTGEVEWYTPAAYVESARKVMCGIDLDPASNQTAQPRNCGAIAEVPPDSACSTLPSRRRGFYKSGNRNEGTTTPSR